MLGGISYTKLLPIIFPTLQPTHAHSVYTTIFFLVLDRIKIEHIKDTQKYKKMERVRGLLDDFPLPPSFFYNAHCALTSELLNSKHTI